MIYVFCVIAVAFAVVASLFILNKPYMAVVWMAVSLAIIAPMLQHYDGIPANADGRLASETWRVVAAAPLGDDWFLLASRYANGDIRIYRIFLPDQKKRDKFLAMQQGVKKGKVMIGKAARQRAGLENDGDMEFSFTEPPEERK